MVKKSTINKAFSRKMNILERTNNATFRERKALLIDEYRKALRDINKKLASIEDFKTIERGRLQTVRNSIKSILLKLTQSSAKNIRGLLRDISSFTFEYTGYSIETSTGLNLGFGLANERVILEAIKNPLDKVGWVRRHKRNSANIIKRINSEIAQGFLQGKSIPQVKKQIGRLMGINGYKATRIARTETRRVQSKSTKMAMDNVKVKASELGIGVKRVWIATADNRTRDVHLNFNGVEENEQGYFEANGYKVEAPSMFGDPELDINCRCTVGMKVDGLKSKELEKHIEAGLKEKDFRQWKKDKA